MNSPRNLVQKSVFNWIVQWSRDFVFSPSISNNTKYLSQKKSTNGKGVIYQVSNQRPASLVTYKFLHEDGKGEILIVLSDLRQFYTTLDQEILRNAENGELEKTEYLCRQRKQIKLNLYTHRLQIFRIKNRQQLTWLIDIDFHKEYSYGSGTAVKVIKSLLFFFLEHPFICPDYRDILDLIAAYNWSHLIIEKSQEFYQNFTSERINCIYSYYTIANSIYKKRLIKAQSIK
ncbi:hypothetical protein PCC7424_3435 [Gloeothece citriformis PCC 7424]|uniref:Uncharacterized protein n=1 Tax=Gloeothece citriformis (strain PCC 7424) TaxID=65393 RepID=B7KFB4_GLOC7|nr:hypothetical protein [Gloeothece citriformis]ACK71830.1 hypothetical protein PCC7424_3435 [Gloeothece citriformis PCC 7424]